ncbi:MAG TPA: hypothetical protein VMT16_06375 [Thermoanaerobaculia bacterium]|nr:hypothetical protein [Thermoanaerobaculia bacterium]
MRETVRATRDLTRLWRDQWRSQEQLERLQLRKLRRMLAYAYHQVPYYRRLFDEVGVRPEEVRSVADLRRIPTTSRRLLQRLPVSEIVARDVAPERCKQLTTAGSTGMPLTVYVRPEDDRFKDLVWARTSLADGRRPWDRTVYFKFQFPPPNWFERFGVWPRAMLSLLDPPQQRVESLRRIRARVLRGNAFELVRTAQAVLDAGATDIRPHAVFSMGSVLDEASRELLERAFGCEVFDCYGATEVGCIAWECRQHRGLHLNVDTTVVELLDGDRPAAPGVPARLVCTGLHGFAMPFIRYEIGDVGVLAEAPCPCGRGLPLLARLEGRADDFFLARDGGWISPSVVVNRVKRTPGVAQFRLTQRTPTRIEALILPGEGFGEESLAAFEATLRDILGSPLALDVSVVDELPVDPGRKIRSMICEVDREALA